jgi:hypothetical protein
MIKVNCPFLIENIQLVDRPDDPFVSDALDYYSCPNPFYTLLKRSIVYLVNGSHYVTEVWLDEYNTYIVDDQSRIDKIDRRSHKPVLAVYEIVDVRLQ